MSWYRNIWKPKKVLVVIIDIQQGNKEYYAYSVTRKQLQKLSVSAPEKFSSFKELSDRFGKNVPYSLHILGTGVLSRKVNNIPTYKDDLIVSGDKENFIFTSYNDGKEVACSFFRIDLIEDELKYMQDEKINLFNVSSGMVPGLTLLDNEELDFGFKIGIYQDHISQFKKSNTLNNTQGWRGENYTLHNFLALSVANSNFNESNELAFSEIDLVKKGKEEFYQFNQFRTYGVGIIGFILMALIGNYFYQNHLNDVVAQLEADLSIQNENLALLDRLDQEVLRKKQLVHETGLGSSHFLSFYLDGIGASVPAEIKLTDMVVFPLEGKLKNKKKVEIQKNRIEISGITIGNIVLDNWVEKLNRNSWVNRVELVNYQKGKDGEAIFKLTVITE